jgi:hypothetical protein
MIPPPHRSPPPVREVASSGCGDCRVGGEQQHELDDDRDHEGVAGEVGEVSGMGDVSTEHGGDS